jgi:hypothetical protein
MISVAGSRTIFLGLLLVVLIAGIPALAGTVDIFSGPGLGSNNQNVANTGIPASPAWAPPPAGAEWISYGDTGCNDFVALTGRCTPGPANPAGTSVNSTPTAIFYQTFTVTDTFDSGYVNVWADDTASVWLDTGAINSGDGSGGILEWMANGTLGNNCADAPIGCTTGLDASIPLGLNAGTYTLVIDAYQLVGGSPFGVMYAGTLTNTPEPATCMLMGLGLVALGTIVRRRKRV